MLPNIFKTSKSLDFDKLMKEYIVKNYDLNSYTNEVKAFIAEFQQNRNVLIALNDKDKTYDAMKSVRDVLVQYLSMLNVIKSKINFGVDEFSIKVGFSWKDVVKNDSWTSYNANFEYYCNLYNLATCYYNLGLAIPSTDEDTKLKEAIKYLQYSAWLFDNIKNEVPSVIPPKETPNDLTNNYLTYCSYICLAQAQVHLLTVAERKKSALELQGQLAKGIFDLYNSAYQLASDSLKKLINEETRVYLNNRKFYYVAISFFKMKDSLLEEFNKSGEGYGKAIAYLGLGVDSLNNGYKDIKKIAKLIDIAAYEDFKKAQEALGTDMYDKNQRIYFQAVPDLANLTKLEKKIMVNPQPIPDNLNALVEAGSSVLDALVPREVKVMIDNYKRAMMDYISENLNKYQNESEIMSFLTELNLPYSLETVLSQNQLSDSLWKKISEVQEKGGSMFLTNNITNLEKKSEDIGRRINDMMQSLANEDEDDSKYRKQYGDRWNRLPSSQLNMQHLNVLKDYGAKLIQAKNADGSIKTGIMDSMKFFELLGLSKNILSGKIPVKTDPNAIKNCEEANALRKELDNMESLKEKIMEVINKIFQNLNEDNIIPQFIQVLQKKTTEKAILNENKPKYDAMFKDLETLSEQVKTLKLSITAKNEVFLRVKASTFKTNEDNEKFFRDLEDYCKLYNQKLVQLQQGINFYGEFNKRLNDISGHISDFLLSRDLDKNELLKYINGGGNYGQRGVLNINTNQQMQGMDNGYWDFTGSSQNKQYLNQSAFMNPLTNLITNMGTGLGFKSNPQSQPQNFNNMNDSFRNMNLSGQGGSGNYNPNNFQNNLPNNLPNNFQNNFSNPNTNTNNNTYANINRFSNQK